MMFLLLLKPKTRECCIKSEELKKYVYDEGFSYLQFVVSSKFHI